MLKEFAQYLVSLKDNKTYDIHGDTYSDHDLVRIKPHIDRPANLSVSGLDSIVKLVRNELDMFENLPVFIRVDDARTVSVFTTYDDMMCRDSLYVLSHSPVRHGAAGPGVPGSGPVQAGHRDHSGGKRPQGGGEHLRAQRRCGVR